MNVPLSLVFKRSAGEFSSFVNDQSEGSKYWLALRTWRRETRKTETGGRRETTKTQGARATHLSTYSVMEYGPDTKTMVRRQDHNDTDLL
jgi:hypothetical protein